MTTAELERFQLVVDGRLVDAIDGAVYDSEDPFAGRPWATVPDGGIADIDAAVASARAAFDSGPWHTMTGFERARLIRRFADLIGENAERLATLEVRDSGKLYREMIGQLQNLPSWYLYYAGLADKIEGRHIPTDKPNYEVFTTREPIGVVAAITPWNSPLLLLTWKLAPGLAAGCTFVIKPSEHAPAASLLLAELALEAGIPAGVINVVSSLQREVGAHLASHPGVDHVAFTGSTGTGRAVAAAAATRGRRVTLELGGKSAQLVFEDADLDAAANGVVAGVFAATGQTCMAGSRLIVHESIFDALVEKVAERARSIRLGNPFEEATEMGPVANRPQFEKVTAAVERARSDGATVVTGGSASIELGGTFYEPTVLTDVGLDTDIVQNEVFGPVLAAYRFTDEAEAVRLANGTPFGLAGSVWTRDVYRAHRVARELKAGTVWVNAYRVVAPYAPFGGFGDSGVGRENGIEAMDEYLQTKTVWIETSGATRDPFKLG